MANGKGIAPDVREIWEKNAKNELMDRTDKAEQKLIQHKKESLRLLYKIIVGVSLDTLQQIESHMIMRNYDGFLKSGRIRGRSKRY